MITFWYLHPVFSLVRERMIHVVLFYIGLGLAVVVDIRYIVDIM